MPFHLLTQRLKRRDALLDVEVTTLSIVAHGLLVAMMLVPASRPVMEEVPESMQWVQYLIPPDKPAGSRPIREFAANYGAPSPGGPGTEAPQAAPDPSRLAVEVPEGVEDSPIVDVPEAPPPAPELPGDTVLTVLEVDSAAARYDDSAAPPYPPSMLSKQIEGTVAVQYVVDTTGTADASSIVILDATHDDFASSVRNTLPLMRFRPALINARKVRQLVQQQFSFRIDTALVARQAEEARKKAKKPTGF